MARYQLTDDAEHDLEAIAEYTYLNHGEEQAEIYRDSLHECFTMLSDYPNVGQEVEHVLKGAKRHAHRHHVIYYKPTTPLLILRVLGGAQDPLSQL